MKPFFATVLASLALVINAPFLLAQQAEQSDANSSGAIEEVIVTAQRREQNLMDVPLSVLAWDGDILERAAISNITLVADITPGLVASGQTTTGGTLNFFIRGIGSNAGGDPAVGYYVDEIYVGASNAFNNTFIDIDRVEVLKGPQGTLWGRNTTGGAINIVTKRPSDTFQGEAFIEFAEHSTVKLAAALSGPISDQLSYRLTASAIQQDSFTQNTLTLKDDLTEDSVSVRGQLRFTPNDQLTIDVLVGYLQDDSKNLFLFPVTNLPDTGAEFVFNYFNVPPNPDLFHIQIDEQPISEFESLETRLDINYQINDRYNVRWLSGYNDVDSFRRADFDGNFLPLLNSTIDSRLKWLSSELQLQYSSDKLDWTLGAYYYDQDNDGFVMQDRDTDFFFMSSCQAPNFSLSANPAAALCPLLNLFWSLNVPDIFFGANPRFALPSLPWFTENILGRSPIPEDMGPGGDNPLGIFGLLPNAILGTGTEFAGGYGNLFGTGLITNQTADSTIKSISFYGQGNYRFNDQWSATVGLRYTEDEKTISSEILGTLFSPPMAPNTGSDTRDAWTPKFGLEFKPHDHTLIYASVTTGFKGAGFGALNNVTGQLTTFEEETVVAYELGYKATLADGRVRVDAAAYYYDYTDMQITLQFATGPITENLDKVEVKGFDLAVDWAPLDNFTIRTSVAYNDSEITEFTGTTVFDPTSFVSGPQDIIGNPLPRAPEWSSNVSANYAIPLSGGNSGSIVLGGSIAYTSDFNHTQFGNVLMTPGYTLWNANVSWYSPSGAFSINVFGRNLSNEEYVLTSFFTDAFGVLLFPGAPRTLGVQVRYNFE